MELSIAQIKKTIFLFLKMFSGCFIQKMGKEYETYSLKAKVKTDYGLKFFNRYIKNL